MPGASSLANQRERKTFRHAVTSVELERKSCMDINEVNLQ